MCCAFCLEGEEVKLSLRDLGLEIVFNHLPEKWRHRNRANPLAFSRVSYAHRLSQISVHTRPHKEGKLGFKPFEAKRRAEPVVTISPSVC